MKNPKLKLGLTLLDIAIINICAGSEEIKAVVAEYFNPLQALLKDLTADTVTTTEEALAIVAQYKGRVNDRTLQTAATIIRDKAVDVDLSAEIAEVVLELEQRPLVSQPNYKETAQTVEPATETPPTTVEPTEQSTEQANTGEANSLNFTKANPFQL